MPHVPKRKQENGEGREKYVIDIFPKLMVLLKTTNKCGFPAFSLDFAENQDDKNKGGQIAIFSVYDLRHTPAEMKDIQGKCTFYK
jgi:hypothetical protein